MGKGKSTVVGYHYRVAFLSGLLGREADAYRECRGGNRTAWQGKLTESGELQINKPNLFGGEKDQGGIVGTADVMFGESTQQPNPYLLSTFGPKTPAWRGVTTFAFKGGRYGAMSPYPQRMSHKVCKIKKGWDNDDCWYPDRAEIAYAGEAPAPVGVVLYVSGGGAWGVFGSGTSSKTLTLPSLFYLQLELTGIYNLTRRVRVSLGTELLWDSGWIGNVSDQAELDTALANAGRTDLAGMIQGVEYARTEIRLDPAGEKTLTTNYYYVMNAAGGGAIRISVNAYSFDYRQYAINPAHLLVYSRTDSEMGREPRSNINEASLRAAADRLYSEGFGLCVERDPSTESPAELEARICRVIGGSFSRSLVDGQWYLDLARGDYDINTLPELTDNDILDFKEMPTTLDQAVNSVSVRYFDPERKEEVITPPVRALGLIRRFGENHQTLDFPEIPNAELAGKVAMRELLAFTTPTRAFEFTTRPKTKAWRPGTYFVLKAPKRRIAQMVCIVGENRSGILRSGAVKLKATQDTFRMADATYVGVEPGEDPRPSQDPVAIAHQRSFEVPYIDVVASLSRADLAALPPESGFLAAIAADPAISRDFTLQVAPDGVTYADAGNGDWCATALVNEAAGFMEEDFTITSGVGLSEVTVGMPVLWDSEICRVKAIDAALGTLSLGRACADTVRTEHIAASRVWFYTTGSAIDTTEYTDGEQVGVRLLTNTSSQQLHPSLATPMAVNFEQRAFRPYPPAQVRLNGEAYPETVSGDVTVTWVHRDRVQQADKLVDDAMAGIGPEPGTTYSLRLLDDDDDSVTYSAADIAGTSHVIPAAALRARNRLELWSVRDGAASWQRHAIRFTLPMTVSAAFTGAAVNEGYAAAVTATTTAEPVVEPVVWTVESGALPEGWVLHGSGATAEVAGIATTLGTYTFVLRAEAADGRSGQAEFTVKVGKYVALLNFEGEDNSTAMVDEVGIASWVAQGNARLSTAQKPFGNTSLYLDGSGDYVAATDATLGEIKGGDYTIHGWYYLSSYNTPLNQNKGMFSNFFQQSQGRLYMGVLTAATHYVESAEQGPNGAPTVGGNAPFAFPLGQWVYVEMSRVGDARRVFFNGVLHGTYTSAPRNDYPGHFRVGRLDAGAYEYGWNGYVKSLGIIAGAGRHTEGYIPPTAPPVYAPANVVANSDFAANSDWINAAGAQWTIAGGRAVSDGTAGDASFDQVLTSSRPAGKYLVEVDVATADAGAVALQLYDSVAASPVAVTGYVDAAGMARVILDPADVFDTVKILPQSTGFIGSIESVRIRRVA